MFLGYNCGIMLKGLVIVVAALGLAYGESSIGQTVQHVAQSNGNTQEPQADKRGTADSPLVVNEHTIESDAQAAEEKHKDAEQEHTDRWIIGLTCGISICAALQVLGVFWQVYVYRQQTRLMLAGLKVGHKNAQAALEAANAASENVAVARRNIDVFISKERARITAVPYFQFSEEFGRDRTNTVDISVRNVGESTAHDVSLYVSVVTTPEGHHSKPEGWSRRKIRSRIRSDEEDPTRADVSFVDNHDISGLPEDASYFPQYFVIDLMGVVRYRDVFGEARETWFRYRYTGREVSVRGTQKLGQNMVWMIDNGRWVKFSEQDNREI